ncbi:MAG: hypothetical protein PHH57_05090 [Candidatus Omnitrophica bacterium]|nr:hypothetical protein [Candidatus Omnitrophota bacterium]
MKLAIIQMILGAAISIGGWIAFLLPLGLYFIIGGLLVLGCGIAQFVNARRVSTR